MTTPRSNLQDTLRRVMDEFRRRAANLSPPQAERIQTVDDLRAPCQITAFCFPAQRWHVFVVTHSHTAPDGQITVHDDVKTWKLFDLLETELESPLWDDVERPSSFFQTTPRDPRVTLRSLGETAFLTIHHNAGVWASADPARNYGNHLSRSLLGGGAATWEYHGDADGIPWDDFLRDAFNDLDPPAAVASPPAPSSLPPAGPPENPRARYPGRGAYHYPGIRVGELPRPRLRARLWARDALPGILVLQDRLGPYELLVTHNGFLGLMTGDESAAIRWLNLAMAGIRQHGHLARPVREADLGAFHRPDAHALTGWGGMWPSRGPPRDDTAGLFTTALTDADLKACLRTAEELATKSYAPRIPWILEAEAHLSDHEPAQSLIFSWAIIEDVVAQRWDRFVNAKQVTGERRKSLRSTREWPLQSRLDALELAGDLDRPTYTRLVTTKRVRNEAMHGARLPTYEEARAALDIAEQVLFNGDPPLRAVLKPSPWEQFL